jgi:hypothetical protein
MYFQERSKVDTLKLKHHQQNQTFINLMEPRALMQKLLKCRKQNNRQCARFTKFCEELITKALRNQYAQEIILFILRSTNNSQQDDQSHQSLVYTKKPNLLEISPEGIFQYFDNKFQSNTKLM